MIEVLMLNAEKFLPVFEGVNCEQSGGLLILIINGSFSYFFRFCL